jgi:hypothetical protein
MAYNFITNKYIHTVTIALWKFFSKQLSCFQHFRKNLSSHKFKGESVMETVVTQWLITQDMDQYQQQIQKLSHDMTNAPPVVGTMWKRSGTAVQLNWYCPLDQSLTFLWWFG